MEFFSDWREPKESKAEAIAHSLSLQTSWPLNVVASMLARWLRCSEIR
jgi:hypothetical protein